MRVALITLTGAAVLVLAGCSSTPEQPPRADSTAPVIAPGRPGEQATTLSPQQAEQAVPTPTVNAADVTFMSDMILHHRQALDMSVLAPTRAANAKVKAIASRIKDSQAPEIQYMTSWLQEQGQKAPDHHAGHAGMPGMATPEQMERLKAASGAAFDSLFLELMIRHHQGAVEMAEKEVVNGSHRVVLELANDVGATQSAEIGRMRRIQAEL
ncbi:MAG: DUF305 domain-containing protein [Thermoactinospora sp.]|nr:DUF305 domain-containing protein [Thermoactinospora sp.]